MLLRQSATPPVFVSGLAARPYSEGQSSGLVSHQPIVYTALLSFLVPVKTPTYGTTQKKKLT